MRRAFSKPTRTDDEFGRLIGGFRSAGYEGLQLKTGQFLPWIADPDGFVDRWGGDSGAGSALIVFDSLDADGLAALRRAVSFAARTGGERVVFCHDHPRAGVEAAQLRGFARTLSQAGAEALEQGVRLSLHHHVDQPVMLPGDVDVFFEEISPGTVGLTVDTAHLAKSGVDDIPAFIDDFASVIDNVHLKDLSDGQWRLLGRGRLDLTGILAALARIGYAGWLCVDEESDADLETGLAASREWLDAHA